MTRKELWDRYVAKNPDWLTDGATFSASGLKRFFDQTFDVGHTLGVKSGVALAEQEHEQYCRRSALSTFSDLFQTLKGK